MPTSSLTELALRSAVNTAPKDISSSATPFDSIKEAALKRGQELVGGNSTLSTMASQSSMQALAITLAVEGLKLGYDAIKDQLGELKDKRLSFDKERLAGIATFLIPTNKEENDLSKQERVIKAVLNLIKMNHSFSSYLGIHTGSSTEIQNAEFYSVLPFYRMSDGLAQPVASPRMLDKQRTAISLFFKSALPDSMDDIDIEFQTENKFIEFWKSAYKKDNYLNDFRSQRFVMMSLANLLWNLQHPVDPETGFPLSMEQCIGLCRDVSLFLNKLLNSNEQAYIDGLGCCNHELLCFVRKVEVHVKSLRAAFIEEHLYELNIKDLTNSAHQTLRTMDKGIFTLLYYRKNPISGKEEPDTKAAEEMAYTVSYLNQLFIDNTDLVKAFMPLAVFAKDSPFVNTPPMTVIDALILFVHSPTENKEAFFKALEQHKSDSIIEFTETLKKFDKKFITPIKEISKKELNVSFFDKKKIEVARLTARRLIPLITLVIEDYRVDADLPVNRAASKTVVKGVNTPQYRAKDQIQEINKLANQGGGYYVWELSPFVELNKETEDILDSLPKHQYRFTEITKLLDLVSDIVQNYRSFLQLKSFQQFLIKCLNKIKEEYTELELHIERVDACLSKDKSISRCVQDILGPMTKNLTGGLDSFSSAFATFERIVSAPDFTEQQRNTLSAKIDSIHQQYSSLFGEDSGILAIAGTTTAEGQRTLPTTTKPLVINTEEPTLTATYSSKHIKALRKWVIQCTDALSLQSRYTEKGTLLNNLLLLIDTKTSFTQEQMQQVIKELAKITLSYRSAYFFQAAYAETRSSKAFIAGLKDPYLNSIVPVKALLFGHDVDVSKTSPAELVERLRAVRSSNQWQESVENMQLSMAL